MELMDYAMISIFQAFGAYSHMICTKIRSCSVIIHMRKDFHFVYIPLGQNFSIGQVSMKEGVSEKKRKKIKERIIKGTPLKKLK